MARRQQAGEDLAVDRFQSRGALRARLRQLQQGAVARGGLGGVEQTVRAAAGVAERGLDGMDAEQPVGRADAGGRGGGIRRRRRRGGRSELLAFAHTAPYDRRTIERFPVPRRQVPTRELPLRLFYAVCLDKQL
jgi:hypothetical protein